MILVMGATGTVGSQVIAALLPNHAGRIRALTRNADAEFVNGVEKVVADVGSSDLTALLGGVDAVFLLSDGLQIAEHDRRVAEAAQQSGARRIVKLSALSVGHGATDPITTWHRSGEETVRDTGLEWTFLRPTAFMSNALSWAPSVAPHDVVQAPFAAGRTAVVDPADIGAVAAACLTESGHNRMVYELTGPDPLSPPDQVAILGRALGRTLAFEEADPTDVVSQMVSYGMPNELARAVVELMRSGQDPFNSQPTGDIAAVTGRPASSFTAWAAEHRDAFLHPSTRW